VSASEKLKALDKGLPRERITEHIMAEGWNPDWATPQKLEEVSRQLRLEAYDEALPQIVAVVEAAELKPMNVYVGIPMDDGRPSGRVRYPLVEALATLEEALS